MFGISQVRLAGYVLAAIALAGMLAWHVDRERIQRKALIDRAVAEEQTKWVLEREAERARQAEVNRQMQEAALVTVRALEAQKTALEADLARMSDEAARDPEKGRLCLSPGAAERLQRIR